MGEKERGSSASALVKGALALGIAAVVSKLIGTLQKIPLQNIAGDGVFGIYNAVYPFYILIVFLATAGFPVTISKFVAEKMAQGDEAGARRILHVSLGVLGAAGVIGFMFLYWGADHIAVWMDNAHTAAAIRACSYALLIVPAMSALRGYFQGKHNMVPTAVSQVAEQSVRVATMVALLLYLTDAGASEAQIAAGATFGSAAGAVAGLLVMVHYKRKERRSIYTAALSPDLQDAPQERAASLTRKLLMHAIPVCLGAIAVPILSIVDTFTVPRLLKDSGLTEWQAMMEFGVYNRGLPLVQLVGMIVSSLSVAWIPILTQAKLNGQMNVIRERTSSVLHWFWLIGWSATAGLALLASPMNTMLYKDDAGTGTMVLVSFIAVASTLNIITGSLLQGLGNVKAPAVHLLAAALVKIGLNIWLVPLWGVDGAAVAGIVSFALAALLNLLALIRDLQLRGSWKAGILRPLLILAVMSIAVGCVLWLVPPVLTACGIRSERGIATLVTLFGVVVGVAAFGISAIRFGAITASDLQSVPKLRKFAAKLERLRLLH